MLSFLKNHPFAVEAFFESSIVLTFAVPKEEIEHLIPSSLKLDTHQDQWAFIAVALVQTKDLRPKGFIKSLGNDFFLIGYRIFVRYTSLSGKNLRGLYILKSETDKKKMQYLGNLFTHYKYTTTDIRYSKKDKTTIIQSQQSDFYIEIEESDETIPLPENSPFIDWKEARRFAGPLPFTFTFNATTNEMLIIEGVREKWIPKPINVIQSQISFMKSLNIQGFVLANAFIIKEIPYQWKKGKVEIWKP